MNKVTLTHKSPELVDLNFLHSFVVFLQLVPKGRYSA